MNNVINGAVNGATKSLSIGERFIQTLFRESLRIWPEVLTGVILFILIWLLAIVIKHAIIRMSGRSKNRKYVYRLMAQTVKIAIIIVGLITALGTMGINIAALVTSLGLTGFALGLALKDPIQNALSGFMILFYQPFKIGDPIKVDDADGIVKEVNLRYTIVVTDDQTILVPNSTVLTKTVFVNKSLQLPKETG